MDQPSGAVVSIGLAPSLLSTGQVLSNDSSSASFGHVVGRVDRDGRIVCTDPSSPSFGTWIGLVR